jgi:Flavin containing amine oxidoreductase
VRADVVIVGGGLAGLACGAGLVGSGLKVVLVEREKILGGRARSLTDVRTGDPVPIGPHIFASEYLNMLAFLEQLGTRRNVVWQNGKFITMVDGQRRITMRMSRLPAPFHFIPSLVADHTLLNHDWLSNVPATLVALALGEEDILDLDYEAAPIVLRRLGVSQHYVERFWSFLSHSILSVPLQLCSAGAIMRAYRRLVGKRGYRLGFADRGLGDLFAPQCRRLIEADGGRVLLERFVKTFTGDAGRADGVELSSGERIEALFCVAALPPHALLATLPPRWQAELPAGANLKHYGPSPYRSVFLWFDQKLTTEQFWARVFRPDDLNCDFYDFSNIYRGWSERPSLIGSNIIYADRVADLNDDAIVTRTVDELAEFLPVVRNARLLHSVVHHVPMAVPAPTVGSEHARLDTRTPIGGLLLAGDWLRTGLPPSMESACFSGFQAAENILRAIDRPKRLAVPHRELDSLAALLGRVVRAIGLGSAGRGRHRRGSGAVV